MTWQLAIPAMVVAAALLVAWFVPNHTDPATGLRLLSASVALVTIASTVLLIQISAAGLTEIPVIADLIGWCRAIYGGQHGASPLFGILAGIALVAMGWRFRAYFRSVRSGRADFREVDGITVVDVGRPLAFAVPGNPGGVVISRSMIDALDREERRVVLAHENSHLRHHHHVYVHAVNGCAAAIPFLVPFARKTTFLTERWADEDAADRVGSRDVVAATVAKVALLPGGPTPAFAQALSGGDVIARYEALQLPRTNWSRWTVAAVASTIALATTATLLQLHHLVDFASHSR